MSQYESEHGSIAFSKNGYVDMMRHARNLYNGHLDNAITIAMDLHRVLAGIVGAHAQARRKAFIAGSIAQGLNTSCNLSVQT
jgi:hypothetical protein